ncbi:FAD-binding domain-containing protein [Trichoderma asperelloides]|nr:FAD-binding domain-containing protein [Trichoderma asperelloides]
MKSSFSSIRFLRQLQNKAPSIRRVSTFSQRQGHQRGPATFLLIGLLLGGVATTSGPKFTLTSNANIDTQPRWSGTAREPLLRSKYADERTMLKAVGEIQSELGSEAVSIDADDIEVHSYSQWSSSNTDIKPVAVVRPKSTEQVSIIAKICSKYKVPMTPYGAGSSMEGNFSSPFSGICIDLSEMNKIVEFHPDDMDVVVQAGVNWMKLNAELKDSGLFLPPDPGPMAYIGGMIATNCSGTNAMRYGAMKDYVVNLTVVLADGTVIKTRQRPRKTSAGYNLNSLFTGSEGTLGIVTEATLKLAILPRSFSVATVAFKSIHAAAAAASSLVRAGLPLAALELMDEVGMEMINRGGGTEGKMWEEFPTLFIKFSGTESSVKESIQEARVICRRHNASSFEGVNTKKEMDALWSARREAALVANAMKPEGTVMLATDVAVPISRMADLIEGSKDKANRHGFVNSVIGHVGDGNFHQAIFHNPNVASDVEKIKDCVDSMVYKAIEMEGTVTGEHGIGIGKKNGLIKELGLPTVGVMKALKDALDPQ